MIWMIAFCELHTILFLSEEGNQNEFYGGKNKKWRIYKNASGSILVGKGKIRGACWCLLLLFFPALKMRSLLNIKKKRFERKNCKRNCSEKNMFD